MRLRILTWNIHKGIGGLDRRYRIERIADVIAHHAPDVALLQEVDSGARRTRRDRQSELLGDMLGFRHRLYHASHRLRLQAGEYGNAILSRFPLSEEAHVDLTIPPKKRRGALAARVRVRRGARVRTLHAWCLHLGLSGLERKAQLRRLLASARFSRLHARAPVLLAGDFNDVYGTLGPKILEPAGFRGPARPPWTYPSIAPVRALDAVHVRGDLEILSLGISRLALAREASDHLPLVADLELR